MVALDRRCCTSSLSRCLFAKPKFGPECVNKHRLQDFLVILGEAATENAKVGLSEAPETVCSSCQVACNCLLVYSRTSSMLIHACIASTSSFYVVLIAFRLVCISLMKMGRKLVQV